MHQNLFVVFFTAHCRFLIESAPTNPSKGQLTAKFGLKIRLKQIVRFFRVLRITNYKDHLKANQSIKVSYLFHFSPHLLDATACCSYHHITKPLTLERHTVESHSSIKKFVKRGKESKTRLITFIIFHLKHLLLTSFDGLCLIVCLCSVEALRCNYVHNVDYNLPCFLECCG